MEKETQDRKVPEPTPVPMVESAAPETTETPAPVRPGFSSSPEAEELKDLLKSFGVPLLVAICIAVGVYAVITIRKTNRESRTEQAIKMAHSAAVQDLSVVVEQYNDTPAVPEAILRLAKTYYDTGNYGMASAKYDEFKQKFPDHILAPSAELGRIYCMEAIEQHEQAAQAFGSFAAKNPKYFQVREALLGQARCLEQLGRLNEAKVIYEDMITSETDSQWTARAKELLELLDAKIKNAAKGAPSASPQAPSM